MVAYCDHMVTTRNPAQAVAYVILGTMDARGLSVKKLADDTGLSRTTLTRRLAGSPFTTAELEAIAPLLGTTPSAILAAAESTAA